jgi:iron complex transport system substrate-binding protein
VLETDPHTIGAILGDIVLVGTATGIASKAMSVVTTMKRRIGAVQGKIHHVTTRPRVYYELDKTLYSVGAGSFMDALITMAGGVNIAGKIANPYPQLSAEKVLTADPQYIILGDAAFGASPAQVASRPGWSTLSAVKLHHIYPFNDDLSSRPGPRIVDGLEKLARLLHPEAFH